MRIRIYAKDVPNRHKRDILHPVGHLSLLSSASFSETCDISIRQNRALINAFLICLLPSAKDVRHPSAQVHGAKVVNYFGLSKKIATFSLISVLRIRFLALLFRV